MMVNAKRLLLPSKYRAFTLIEMLLALVVAGIVSAAVVTLAYAISSANDVTDNLNQTQAYVRYATNRISEMIRHCKLVCGMPEGDMVIWRADDNGNRQINIGELVYIARGPSRNYLRLYEFSSNDAVVNLSDIGALTSEWWLSYGCNETYTQIVPQCGNVEFVLDVAPPDSRLVGITFDIVENGVTHRYQINAAVNSWAGYLLDDTGEVVDSDDD